MYTPLTWCRSEDNCPRRGFVNVTVHYFHTILDFYTMPYATIASGTRLYYERIGSGPPLLLVMGTGLDHSVWDAQVEAYRNEFECIVFDNAGTGKSGRPDERLTVRSMAADTAGLLEALGIERTHVSGVSLGSCIAQELTLARPDMVASLQLHGTWATWFARRFAPGASRDVGADRGLRRAEVPRADSADRDAGYARLL